MLLESKEEIKKKLNLNKCTTGSQEVYATPIVEGLLSVTMTEPM